jgi:hypothetical protein
MESLCPAEIRQEIEIKSEVEARDNFLIKQMPPTHVHILSGQKVRIKKIYGNVATCYVEPYPISIVWGKEEYSDTIICNLKNLIPCPDYVNLQKKP